MLISVDSGHLRDLSVRWEHNINIDVSEKVYEDVDWTPVNYECINTISFMVLATNDVEDKYNRRITKQS